MAIKFLSLYKDDDMFKKRHNLEYLFENYWFESIKSNSSPIKSVHFILQ